MCLAPRLYALHAVLTGLAMALMDVLGIKLGFGFSAGLLDYALNFSKATRPLLLVPVGIVYFLLYYGVFRFAILRFNLKTPGRSEEHTSELQSLMRNSYDVFCLKKQTKSYQLKLLTTHRIT